MACCRRFVIALKRLHEQRAKYIYFTSSILFSFRTTLKWVHSMPFRFQPFRHTSALFNRFTDYCALCSHETRSKCIRLYFRNSNFIKWYDYFFNHNTGMIRILHLNRQHKLGNFDLIFISDFQVHGVTKLIFKLPYLNTACLVIITDDDRLDGFFKFR